MPRPLDGIGVVVTRPPDQAEKLDRALRDLGADVVRLPLTVIVGREAVWTAGERTALDAADVLVLSSVNGVRELVRQMPTNGWTPPTTLRLVAVGPRTAGAMEAAGLRVDLTPEQATGAAVADALAGAMPAANLRVMLARSRSGRPELPQALIRHGARVDELVLYETRPVVPDAATLTRAHACAVWTFLSPSSVDSAVAAVGAAELRRRWIVSIGPTTSAHLNRLGLSPAAEARERSSAGIAHAVAAAVRVMRTAGDQA